MQQALLPRQPLLRLQRLMAKRQTFLGVTDSTDCLYLGSSEE
jgi:hypothetical protein